MFITWKPREGIRSFLNVFSIHRPGSCQLLVEMLAQSPRMCDWLWGDPLMGEWSTSCGERALLYGIVPSRNGLASEWTACGTSSRLPLKHEKSRFSASVSTVKQFPPANVPRQCSSWPGDYRLFNPNTRLFPLLYLDRRQIKSKMDFEWVLSCTDFKFVPVLLFPCLLSIPEEFSNKICKIITWEEA